MCGGSPPPPDYTPVAEASAEAAQIAADQANRQLEFAQRQYDENAPFMREIAEQQMGIMQRTSDQGDAYFQHWRDNFQGLERDMVADAQNFNTDAYRNQLATQAAADAGLAFQATNAASERAMRSMGVNPNSGRWARRQDRNGLDLAKMRAGAMNRSRQQSEAMGYARKMDAVGLGRGMPGASQGAYSVATGAGSSAGNMQGLAGQQMLGAMQGAGGLMMQGTGQQLGGLQSIMGSQSSLYGQGMGNRAQMIAGGLGMIGGIMSDIRLKENIKPVGTENGYNVYTFNYKGGKTKFRGVLAQEVMEITPDAVGTDELTGMLGVDYDMIGVKFKEVG